jgi:hypothetical protein
MPQKRRAGRPVFWFEERIKAAFFSEIKAVRVIWKRTSQLIGAEAGKNAGKLGIFQLSAYIPHWLITVVMAVSNPSGGYLYFFSSFLTRRRMPARADSFFCQSMERLIRSILVSS